MSEIKVRIWDNEQKKMLYFHPLTLTLNSFTVAAQRNTFDREEKIDTYTTAPNKDIVVMLESGFQVIWENDVLEGEAPTGVVRFGVFDNKKAGPEYQAGSGFYLETRYGIRSLSQLMIDVLKYKVIGNICEQPDLLKRSLRW